MVVHSANKKILPHVMLMSLTDPESESELFTGDTPN